MQKHLLLTLSGDQTYQYAIRFISSFFHNRKELKATLFYLAPNPNKHLQLHEDSGSSIAEAGQQSVQYRQKGEKALNLARKFMKGHGFNLDLVEKKFKFKNLGTVQDIIIEGERGLYDAVVLGRRGLSALEELMEDSVSRQVMSQNVTFPLWFCKEPDPERKNVLLCADGSPQSLRVADHVGFILEDCPKHKVTLFHVCDKNTKLIEECFTKTREKLKANNFSSEQIDQQIVPCANVSETIVNYAQEHKYAVVAMGSTGAGQKGLSRLFMGSASLGVLKSLSGFSLWISR